MAKNEAQIKFRANTSELESGIKKMNSSIQTFNAQLKLNASQLKANAGDTSLLRERQNILEQQLEASRSKVELTNEKLNEAKAIWGEDSEEVQVYTRQLLAAQNQEQAIQNALASCNTELKEAENALAQASEEGKNTETAYSKLSSTIEEQKSELESLKSEYINVTLEQGKDSDEAKALGEKITALNNELSNNKDRLETAEQCANKLTDAMDKAGDSASKASNGGFTIFKGIISDLATNAIQFGIDKIKDFGKAILDTGLDFGTANSQLAATMGATTEEISELTEFAQQMGSTTAFTATQAAEGLNTLAMSGLNATEQMDTLPGVLNLASAGALSLEDSASFVTGAIKGFGDSTQNAQKYVDIMAKGATLANTDVKGLGEALSGSAATASAYSQTVEGTSLALLKLAEQNTTGSEAATTLNRAMADLFTPTKEAKEALDGLGVSAYDLSTGAARDINDVMNDLQNALSGVSEEEKNTTLNTIFTTNGLQAYNKMSVTTADTAKKFADGLATASDAMDGQGAAAEQAATQLDNLGGDVTLMESAFDGFKMQIYNDVDGPLREMVQGVTSEAIPAMSEMYEGFKNGVAFIKEHKAATESILVVIGSLAAGIKAYNIVTGIKTALEAKEGATLLSVAAAQIGLNTAMLTSPITWIVALIVGLVAGFVLLWNKCDGFRNFWIGAWDSIKNGFSTAVGAIKGGVDKVKDFFGGLKDSASEKISGLKDTFTENGGGIKGAAAVMVQGVQNSFETGFNALNKITGGKLGEVKEAAAEKLGELKEAASEKISGLKDTFTENGGGIKGAAAVYMSMMKSEFDVGYNAINKLTGGKLGEVLNTAKDKFEGIKSSASEKLNALKDAASTGLSNMKSTFESKGGGIKGAAAVVMSGIQNNFNTGFSALNKLTGGKLGELASTMGDKLNNIKQKFHDLVEKVKSIFNFKINWPTIKAPSVVVTWDSSGSLAKAAQLLGFSGMPHFSIRWNAEGAILTKPTLFGFAGGKFQGGGEAGPEAVLPINRLEEYINNGMMNFLNSMPRIDEDRLAQKIAIEVSKRPVVMEVNKRELARIN